MNWLKEVFSEPDGTPSSRRILFAIAIVYALGLVTGALYKAPVLTPEMVDVIKTVLWTAAAALGVGKFAENPK